MTWVFASKCLVTKPTHQQLVASIEIKPLASTRMKTNMLTQPHIIVRRTHTVHMVASLKLIALATRGECSLGYIGHFFQKTSSPRSGNVKKLTKYIEKSKLEEMGQ